MAVEIRVPALGESVVEATIARWLKNEGEPVTAGEPLVNWKRTR
jgi:2-oxoglutarate dehydrogenase E2 component (dihydrolipoamide succinyltransferase)